MEMKEASLSQPRSRHEISQDFPSLSALLASCECGEEVEMILNRQQIFLKDLPDFSEAELSELGIARGPAKRINKALMKYRLNAFDLNGNQVFIYCVDCDDCINIVDCVDCDDIIDLWCRHKDQWKSRGLHYRQPLNHKQLEISPKISKI